jgi:hypothetical protein
MAPEQCIVLCNIACPKSQIFGARSATFKSQKPINWLPVRKVLSTGKTLPLQAVTSNSPFIYIEYSFCRLIRRLGSFLESLIGRQYGSPQQTAGLSFGDHLISAVLRHQASCYCALFCGFMAHVRYNLEQRVFFCDCNAKRNSYKSCRRKFRSKLPDTTCPYRVTISKSVKKVWTHDILIDRKQLKGNRVLTEKNLMTSVID